MQDTLSLAELNAWIEFDKINPITDRKRIYGPAALIASAMSGKFETALQFLHPTPKRAARNLKPVEVIRTPKE